MLRNLYKRKWKVQGSTLDIEPCRENFGNNKLAAPRNSVYDVMDMVDPEGLERRGNVGQKKRGSGRFLFTFI